MGVYIKGMEMPTSCFDCNFCVEAYEGAGVYSCVVSDKCVCRGAGRHDDCPLVPVPPHGRLIDADALAVHKFAGAEHDISIADGGACYRRGWNDAIEAIMENTETIIGEK